MVRHYIPQLQTHVRVHCTNSLAAMNIYPGFHWRIIVGTSQTSDRANRASELLADRSRQNSKFVNAALVRYPDSTRVVVISDVGCCSCMAIVSLICNF